MTKKKSELFVINTPQVIKILEALPPETRVYQGSYTHEKSWEHAGMVMDAIKTFRHPNQSIEIPSWNCDGMTVQLYQIFFGMLEDFSNTIPCEFGEYCVALDYTDVGESRNLPELKRKEPKGPSRRKLLPRAFG